MKFNFYFINWLLKKIDDLHTQKCRLFIQFEILMIEFKKKYYIMINNLYL